MSSKKPSKKSSGKKASVKKGSKPASGAVLSKDQLKALEEGRAKLAQIQAGKGPAPAAVPAIISSKSGKKASSKKRSAKKASAKKASVKKASVKAASVKKASVKRASRKSAKKASAKAASVKKASAKRASKKASRKSAKRASAKRASAKRASKKASRKSAKRASAKRASRKSRKCPPTRKSAKRRSAKRAGVRKASRKSAKRASAKRASAKRASKRASRKSAKRASAKRASAKRASKKAAKRASAKRASKKAAKRASAKRASAKRASAKKASRKSAKRASARKASRKSAKRASARKASVRKASLAKAGAKKVIRRPKSKKAARKGTKKMAKKQLSQKQLAALAKGRAKRAAKLGSKPATAKPARAKRKSAKRASVKAASGGKKHRKVSKKASAYKSLSRAMRLLAPKPRKARKGRKPSAKAMHHVPTGRYTNKAGAQILIRRTYAQNPTYDIKDLAVGGGGLFVGVILADLADRFVATRAPKDVKEALTGDQAAAAIRANADGVRLGVQGGATALFGIGAYLLRNKSPMAAFGVGGLAVAFGGKFLNMLVTDVLMPRIFKPSTDATKPAFGDRFYYDKKLPPPSPATPGLPYGFRRQGYQGLPGFLGAPQQQNGKRPFESAPANVGPVATGAGTVGCGSCGSNGDAPRYFAGMNLGEVFPSAKTTCNKCKTAAAMPGCHTCSKCQGPKDQLEVVSPPAPAPVRTPVMPQVQPVEPVRVAPIVPTPAGRMAFVQPQAPSAQTMQPQSPVAAGPTTAVAQVQGQAEGSATVSSLANLMAAAQTAYRRSGAGVLARPRR